MSLLAVTSGDVASGVVSAEGVDFDGTYDYLSRSTDLVGNVDSKTFTFSCWVYVPKDFLNGGQIYDANNGNIQIRLLSSSGKYAVSTYMLNSSLSVVLQSTGTYGEIATDSFNHISISIDLANTANRHIYINDNPSIVTWNSYVNDFIDFTKTLHGIGARAGGASKAKGRLSHLFLDYTYRDLSIEANRRLFITADGKPTPMATLKALNPILYLPMKDAATAHINEGTGGNFTPNGTYATSNRGANQDNCVASAFNGNSQYLSRNNSIGLNNSSVLTLSFWLNPKELVNGKNPIRFTNSSNDKVLYISYINGTTLRIESQTQFGVSIPFNKNTYSFINLSFDLSSTLKRHVILDGKDVSNLVTWNTYTNSTMNLSVATQFDIGAYRYSSTYYYTQAILGELYYDTKYIGLASNNPFWDSVENKPVPVRKVIANTGVTPLIAMPLDASNPGKNYGTGGDFTANSAPYVGARGASEFWARSAKFDGSTGYLEKTLMSATFPNISMLLCACKYSTSLGFFEVRDLSGSTYGGLKITCNSTTIDYTVIRTNGGSQGFSYTTTTTTWKIVALTVDWTTTTNNIKLWVNGVNVATQSYDTLGVPSGSTSIRAQVGNAGSEFSMCYFTTDYIDFSQEVNRLKFVDGLGYPLDLKKQIEAGVIPKPLFYLPFDDPSNLGKDASGNNNHFTVVGTVTQGADVNG